MSSNTRTRDLGDLISFLENGEIMYYEEKVIDGIMHFRTSPEGAWIKMSLEMLTTSYLQTKEQVKEFQAELSSKCD